MPDHSGIVGGVLTLPSFTNDFPGAKTDATRSSSLTVSLQQLGAFVACFAAWPITHRYGRRKTLMLSSLVFIVGVIIETINTHSLPAFYVGRVIAGLGLGCATVVVPMYSSEMSPPDLRGQIGCFFQFFFTIGILISYWVDYGVKVGMSGTDQAQWQIPIALQMVPAGILGLGMLTLKDSVRWYMYKGREQEAWDSLRWIRASDGPAVQAEMEEIRKGVELEKEAREGFKFSGMAVVTCFLNVPSRLTILQNCSNPTTSSSSRHPSSSSPHNKRLEQQRSHTSVHSTSRF